MAAFTSAPPVTMKAAIDARPVTFESDRAEHAVAVKSVGEIVMPGPPYDEDSSISDAQSS